MLNMRYYKLDSKPYSNKPEQFCHNDKMYENKRAISNRYNKQILKYFFVTYFIYNMLFLPVVYQLVHPFSFLSNNIGFYSKIHL